MRQVLKDFCTPIVTGTNTRLGPGPLTSLTWQLVHASGQSDEVNKSGKTRLARCWLVLQLVIVIRP